MLTEGSAPFTSFEQCGEGGGNKGEQRHERVEAQKKPSALPKGAGLYTVAPTTSRRRASRYPREQGMPRPDPGLGVTATR
jgi:hypothetical protein